MRVSALEITSQREEIRDLLAPYETENDAQSPGVYLRQLPTPAGLQKQVGAMAILTNWCIINDINKRLGRGSKNKKIESVMVEGYSTII